MATATGHSGKGYGVIIGIEDIGETSGKIGTATVTGDFVTNTKIQYGLPTVNDIAWDASVQRTEIIRSGRTSLRSEDIVQHYGSGVWTWDFDWPVDNEIGLQNLLNLMYPSSATTPASTDGWVIPANPTTVDYSHAIATGADRCASVIIQSPEADEDRHMHSAILQTLTLSMSADTNGGRLNASGQFMSGYKPVVGPNTHTADSSPSNFAKTLFDCDTHTINSQDVAVRAFSITISRPATRVASQGTDGETDGYVRGGPLSITGSATVKADHGSMDLLTGGFIDNAICPIVFADSSVATELTINMPSCHLSGHNLDMAEDAVFVEIPFTATSGADSGAVMLTLKATSAT